MLIGYKAKKPTFGGNFITIDFHSLCKTDTEVPILLEITFN